MNSTTDLPQRQPLDSHWVARCSRRLRQQWPHAELMSLDDAAAALSIDPTYRDLAPEAAAEAWLAPLGRGARHRAATARLMSASLEMENLFALIPPIDAERNDDTERLSLRSSCATPTSH